jgi:hypothetical protein
MFPSRKNSLISLNDVRWDTLGVFLTTSQPQFCAPQTFLFIDPLITYRQFGFCIAIGLFGD